ncbi:ABC transporter permease [Streptacidiphilus albus]|uniref:ABC transporter permease n=1 Tax=Streptacidiphilus albus TaxID=105425 RepID=UPI00054B5595|nr:ABC transporter permease [Streptacidiphilus albus]
MLRFLTRRALGAIVILICISIITYIAFFAIVPDPARLSCGAKNCTPQMLEQIRINLGFNKSIPVQYWDYMHGIFFGRNFPAFGHCVAPCFGYSFADQEPVWTLIKSDYPTTLTLAVMGALMFLVIGVGLGMISAWKPGSTFDRIASSLSLIGQSTQIYFIGPLLIVLFVVDLGWLSRGSDPTWSTNPIGSITGMLLPAFTMSVIFWSNYSRQVRSLMLEQLSEDHIRAARAKGMSKTYVFMRYALRGAMGPIVTIFGIDLGAVFGGAIITEYTFSLHGLGTLAVSSVNASDLPMEMGVMLFSAASIVIFNVIVDASYALIDPRIRLA